MSATARIANFVVGTSYDDLPPEAVEKAKKVIADSFAAIASGAGSELAPTVSAYLDREGSTGPAPIIGTGRRVAPEVAALVNGTFGAALDFDDVVSIMPAHPSAVIVAALCAVNPDRAADGRRFIESYVLGLETGAKIALGIGMGHYGRGFHATGTLALFSAVAAASKLAGLDRDELRTAFGIAASNAGGLLCNIGTMTKPLHSGNAAQTAVRSVNLARCGYTATKDVFDAKNDFFQAYGTADSDAGRVPDLLGRPWTILDPGVTLKKFPSCYAAHRAIDGVQKLRAEGLTLDDLEEIECRVAPGLLNPLLYPRPRDGLQSKFSMPYAIAAALLDDEIRIGSFETEAANRPELGAIYRRISVVEDEGQVAEDPSAATKSWGSRGYFALTAKRRSGPDLAVRVDVSPGHPARELGWDDLQRKLADCAASAGLAAAQAASAFAALKTLEACPDVRAVVGDLTRR